MCLFFLQILSISSVPGSVLDTGDKVINWFVQCLEVTAMCPVPSADKY